MMSALIDFLWWYDWAIVGYVFLSNTVYLVLMLTGFLELLRYRFVDRGSEEGGARQLSPLVPPISILVPAYNEELTICESVRAMLALRYPEYEVIVVNDGSSDSTLATLTEEFHLYRSARYYETPLDTAPIRGIYESMDPVPLVVVDKENVKMKADALNVGINVARYPLFCAVDADSILESNALIRVAYPFVEDPDRRVLAVGGMIRAVNGCEVHKGRVMKVSLPDSRIAILQTIEYLRAFLFARTGFATFNCLLIVSGAFGLFSRRIVIEVGGFDTGRVGKVLGEDMELIFRLHRWALERKKKYRIESLPDPVCWTEVPESLQSLRSQRIRWQRASIEAALKHKKMICNPRYGLFGTFALPYVVLFDIFGPVVELSGYFITILAYYFGIVSWVVPVLFMAVSVLYGTILSIFAVLFEQITVRRYPTARNLLKLLFYGLVENLGYRQLLTFWRIQAFGEILFGKKAKHEALARKGFQKSESAAVESA